jgi:hypothetical protein
MAEQDVKTIDYLTKNDSSIITSTNNKELKKHIKDISQQVLKRNYELYKALENK